MNVPFLGVIFTFFIFFPLSQLIITHSETKALAEKRIFITTIILAIVMASLGIIDKLLN